PSGPCGPCGPCGPGGPGTPPGITTLTWTLSDADWLFVSVAVNTYVYCAGARVSVSDREFEAASGTPFSVHPYVSAPVPDALALIVNVPRPNSLTTTVWSAPAFTVGGGTD